MSNRKGFYDRLIPWGWDQLSDSKYFYPTLKKFFIKIKQTALKLFEYLLCFHEVLITTSIRTNIYVFIIIMHINANLPYKDQSLVKKWPQFTKFINKRNFTKCG